MDWIDFFWSCIIFYAGIAVGIGVTGLGNAARDDQYNEPHGM